MSQQLACCGRLPAHGCSCRLHARCCCHRGCGRQERGREPILSAATDEPRLAGSAKKSCGSLFLAAISSRLLDGYSRTCECRAPFGMPTKGMVEVSPEVPSRMTPFCRCTKTGPGTRRFPLSGTHFHFFSLIAETILLVYYWTRPNCTRRVRTHGADALPQN